MMRSPIALAALLAALPAVARADSPDGRYSGPMDYQYVGNNPHGHCQNGFTGHMTVKNGVVTVATNDGPNTATLGPDGSFDVRAGGRVITGKIAGGKATGTWTFGPCKADFSLPKGG